MTLSQVSNLMTNILNHVNAGLRLRFLVSSSTCNVLPVHIATDLQMVVVCGKIGLSKPMQWNVIVVHSVHSTCTTH